MANPNTTRQKVREEAERAINRELERTQITDEEVETALSEWDVSAYEKFFADCREAGHDTSRCGAIWTTLKERGEIMSGNPDDDADQAEDTPMAAQPALPVPETIEELESELVDADNVYLLVTTGCPSCEQAREALSDWIDDGLVDVLNIQQSDTAADIVIETGLDALPALVLEDNGDFTAL